MSDPKPVQPLTLITPAGGADAVVCEDDFCVIPGQAVVGQDLPVENLPDKAPTR